jgi:hypothetical protein
LEEGSRVCTVSWFHQADGYQLFGNRDERRTRQPALAPRIRARRGVRFIAPVDGDGGGSWIGVNHFGLALCLLNRYDDGAGEDEQEYTSRGLLLMELMDCRSRDEAQRRIAEAELARFRPFTLAALEAGQPARLIEWTGRERLIASDGEARMPLISSSFRTAEVTTFRREHFAQLRAAAGEINTELLRAFHGSHAPQPGAYSPCMHRADAQTVSFSQITVAGRTIEFRYRPQALCADGPETREQLVRLNGE